MGIAFGSDEERAWHYIFAVYLEGSHLRADCFEKKATAFDFSWYDVSAQKFFDALLDALALLDEWTD